MQYKDLIQQIILFTVRQTPCVVLYNRMSHQSSALIDDVICYIHTHVVLTLIQQQVAQDH